MSHWQGMDLLQQSAQNGCKFAMELEQDILFKAAPEVCNKRDGQKFGRLPRQTAIVPKKC